jgi:tetratricopeptide (TPR) repeat protein
MSQKKRRPRTRDADLSRKVVESLLEVDDLVRRKQWDEARVRLEELDRCHPKRLPVLAMLAEVCLGQGDTLRYQVVCEQVVELDPRADFVLALAGAYLENNRPLLALRTLHGFLDRWSDHPHADRVRKDVAKLEKETTASLRQAGLDDESGHEATLLEEEMKSYLETGKLAESRRAAERLLERKPGSLAVLNNVAEIFFREGRFAEALDTVGQVLRTQPENAHALANRARFLFLSGREAEARAEADRLKSLNTPTADLWVKKAEAFAYLGEDAAVREALRGAEQAGSLAESPHRALLYHLAAVAAYRLGDQAEARRLWRTSLKADPDFAAARENLDDLRRPAAERHAPWYFALPNWMPEQTIDDLARCFRAAASGRRQGVDEPARRCLVQHPELAVLVPALLDRGDPGGREFALRLAVIGATPAFQQALQDFAFGQRGPDQQRMEAADAIVRAGLAPPGPVRMWMNDAWRDVLLLGFELHGEATQVHSPRVEPLVRQAMDAIHSGKGAEAERLLQRALKLEPNSPTLLNNLAAAYQVQGRFDESNALIRDLYRRFPDYFFARVNLAAILAKEGKPSEARALVEPLLAHNRLHYTEFAALCMAQIEIGLAEKNRPAAQSWLELWERGYPDHPALPRFRREVGGLWSRLLRRV